MSHNQEADEISALHELEEQLSQDAIGSTLYSKKWLLQTLECIQHDPDNHLQDLESISDMSTDLEVASFLAIDAGAQFELLALLLKDRVSLRVQEFALVILANMLKQEFAVFRYESSAVDIPSAKLNQECNQDPDYVQVLVVAFQYLTIFNDCLMECSDFDESVDQIEHNFSLALNVTLIMASTLNHELLHKSSRYLFSVLELASETNDPVGKLDSLLSPPALGFINEALKQALDYQDEKTSFLIVEIFHLLFDFIDEVPQVLQSEHSEQICETISRYLKTSSDLELNSVKSCAKICASLWTSVCHIESFELIGQIYFRHSSQSALTSDDDRFALEIIKSFLLQFVNQHSASILSSQELLNRPVLGIIVDSLSKTE